MIACENCAQPLTRALHGPPRRFCGDRCRKQAKRAAETSPVPAPVTGEGSAVRAARVLIAALADPDEADLVHVAALLRISEQIDGHPTAAMERELRATVDALMRERDVADDWQWQAPAAPVIPVAPHLVDAG